MTEPADIWAAIAAVSSAIATLAVLIATVVAVWQLRESARVRQLEVLQNIFAAFHTDTAREDRQYVYAGNFPNYGQCPQEQRDRVERLIVVYQHVAYLETKRLVPTDVLLEQYSGTFAAAWQKLERYIKTKRAETGLSNYARAFQDFATRAIAYRAKNFNESATDYVLAR